MTEPTYDQLKAVFDAAGQPPAAANGEWEPPTPLVDWVAAYGLAEDPARWLAEPLIPDNSAVALFAKGGTGKSLFALWLAAELITRPEPVRVLYLDYEMTIATVVARLEDMGHDDPTTLGHLQYASLPSLPPLDTQAGGLAVVDMAKHLHVRLVVIDTFGRAVNGAEDLADTVRDWYRWTGQLLKTAGISFLRIDHAGKDMKRGQRGTSAKNDDVDVVWEMTERGRGEFLLRATKRRVDWIEERLVIRQTSDNGMLGYTWDTGVTYRAGAKEVAADLDMLGAPVDISRRQACLLLQEHKLGRDSNVVGDALRWRKSSVDLDHPVAAAVRADLTPADQEGLIPVAGMVNPDERPLTGALPQTGDDGVELEGGAMDAMLADGRLGPDEVSHSADPTTKHNHQSQRISGSDDPSDTAVDADASPQVITPEYQSIPPGEPDGIGRSTYVSRCPIPGLFDPIEEDT